MRRNIDQRSVKFGSGCLWTGFYAYSPATFETRLPVQITRSLSVAEKTLWVSVRRGGLACIAALLPNLPSVPSNPLDYPVPGNKLLQRGTLFAIAYGAVAIAVVQPVRVRPRSMERFVSASAWLLSAASERDQADYLPDLLASLPTLIKTASFGE